VKAGVQITQVEELIEAADETTLDEPIRRVLSGTRFGRQEDVFIPLDESVWRIARQTK
jgi:hemin uptake protein HemP